MVCGEQRGEITGVTLLLDSVKAVIVSEILERDLRYLQDAVFQEEVLVHPLVVFVRSVII